MCSANGFDQVFQGNYLGHFLLTHLLSRELVANHGRVVNVSSGTHDPNQPLVEFMRLPPPVFTLAEYLKDPLNAPKDSAPSLPFRFVEKHGKKAEEISLNFIFFSNYATSKLCQILSTFELHRSIQDLQIPLSVVAYDPGLNGGTSLARDFPWLLRKLSPLVFRILQWRYPGDVCSPQESGPWLADLLLVPEKRKLSGVYFHCDKVIETSAEALDREKQRDLWNTSIKWLKLTEQDTILPLEIK